MFTSGNLNFTSAQTKVDFIEYKLTNGLTVILTQDNSSPIVTADVWYHVGSKDEDSAHTGFAHLFEHMMFQGSKNVAKTEHFNLIQNAGGTLNGTTNVDRTNYFESVPSNQLELILWLEADRMGFLNVNQDNFDNQREVVKEEKRQRYDNVPYGDRAVYIVKNIYPEHPYRWLTIGSMQHLTEAPLSYAQQFYKSYYGPNNAVLVVSGDINYDDTKKLIEKYFGDLKPVKEISRNYPENKFHLGEGRETVKGNVQLPQVTVSYKVPGTTSQENYPLQLLADILGNGKSSRLYRELVYKNKIVKSVNCSVWDNELGGSFNIVATGFKTSKPEDIEAKINEVVEQVTKELVSEIELAKVKNSAENDFINRIATNMGKADLLARYKTFFGDANKINTDLDNYLNVSVEEILINAQKYLTADNRFVLYYLPNKN